MVAERCPGPRHDAIHFYDGTGVHVLFDDGLSNQSPVINDYDEIAWTNYLILCEAEIGEWTSDIMLYTDGAPVVLPVTLTQCNNVAINNGGVVIWACENGSEFWDTVTTHVFTMGHASGDNPVINDRGDIAFNTINIPVFPWQEWVYRDGQFYRISNDIDSKNAIDNHSGAINEAGEVAWAWFPNGQLSPCGTRFMRRIRNSDVNFDGLVDINDLAALPGCFTGPTPTDGLCECRFFDIDHDRDIDDDDLDLLLGVYTGEPPVLSDCNENGAIDIRDLIDGTARDCNLNGVPDNCDLAEGTSPDGDGDGMPDECCPGSVARTDTLTLRNRYLTLNADGWAIEPPLLASNGFVRHSPKPVQAIRVTLTDLPSPFDVLNGQVLWVGEPREICENSGKGPETAPEDCPAALPTTTFWAAALQCEPYYTDWSVYDNVHVHHATVVPGGTYGVQTILEGCGVSYTGNYSTAVSMTQARWGDVCGPGEGGACTAPADGSVDVTNDVLGVLDKFANVNNLQKARADLEPGDDGSNNGPDLKVNVANDVLYCLDAFTGAAYPFTPGDPCAPGLSLNRE